MSVEGVGHSKAESHSLLCKEETVNFFKGDYRIGFSQDFKFFSDVHIWIAKFLIFLQIIILTFTVESS